MGQIKLPRPVKLFAGVIYSEASLLTELEERLARLNGPIDLRSEPFSFDSTDYYYEEMGKPLFRVFLSFEDLILPERISPTKITTNLLEAEMAARQSSVKRPVNIDPGYLEESKIVLASTKNFSHRIHISAGIYAEVTMQYEGKEWRMLPWTFPDFRSGRYNPFFTALRNRYRAQLKDAGL
jgi:hypothetical protein